MLRATPLRIQCLDDLVRAARLAEEPPRIAIARCKDDFVLASGVLAREHAIAEPIFIGDLEATRPIAEKLGIDLGDFTCIHADTDGEAVGTAIRLYKEGEAALIMKGLVSTATLLKAILDKEHGVPPKGLLSHVGVFSLPSQNRLVIMTDAGVNIRPTLQRKVDILKNALYVARALGIERPRAALLAATEKVNYPAMPATLDADIISKMADQGEFGDAIVHGPMALDIAISPEAARRKGYDHPVAGRADVLVVPDIESGNVLYKAVNSLMRLDMASSVVGSDVPIVVPSRGDSERTRVYSMALGVYLARVAERGPLEAAGTHVPHHAPNGSPDGSPNAAPDAGAGKTPGSGANGGAGGGANGSNGANGTGVDL
ncbi:MAG: phosphate butyryltransferase [Desulfovibrionaceae bacterium]|jgi:phosphate butyryltransferase|nr:phosphate butyryltransferase [Desulfovibrionaceae bacterium]